MWIEMANRLKEQRKARASFFPRLPKTCLEPPLSPPVSTLHLIPSPAAQQLH